MMLKTTDKINHGLFFVTTSKSVMHAKFQKNPLFLLLMQNYRYDLGLGIA